MHWSGIRKSEHGHRRYLLTGEYVRFTKGAGENNKKQAAGVQGAFSEELVCDRGSIRGFRSFR